jgi:hypothetical protein
MGIGGEGFDAGTLLSRYGGRSGLEDLGNTIDDCRLLVA